jgi:hypothetical protein
LATLRTAVREKRAEKQRPIADAGEAPPPTPKENEMADEWMTTEKICELFEVHPSLPGQWYQQGKLGKKREKEGRGWKYPREVVMAFKATRDGGATSDVGGGARSTPAAPRPRATAATNGAAGDVLTIGRRLRWLIRGARDGVIDFAEVAKMAESDEVREVLGE